MLIVDAGPLIAAAGIGDRHHESCMELLAHASRPLVVPALVVAEVAYLLADRIGAAAERAFVRSLELGELTCEAVEPRDWHRIGELLTEYEDLGLGAVDASVLVLCERLAQTELATLDRRHFSVVRPRHCPALTLLPD